MSANSILDSDGIFRCIPLAALVTPATLSVKAKYMNVTTSEPVASLNISTLMLTFEDLDENLDMRNAIQRFAEIRSGTHGEYWIVGSSLHLAKIVSASAGSGEIFRIAKPLSGPNMTYQIDLHIPVIKCESSSTAVARNTTAAAVIAAGEGGNSSVPFDFHSLDMSQLEYHNDSGFTKPPYEYPPMKIGYFAMVPKAQDNEKMTQPWHSLDDLEVPTNQLWVVIADHGDDNSTKPCFLTCRLWNASLSLHISYRDDVQSVQPESFTYINEVQAQAYWFGMMEPWNPPVNMANMVYTALFLGICEQLTGLVVSTFIGPDYHLHDDANIKSTTLTGSSEFVGMIKNLSESGEDSLPLNKSLSALIEELSLNASLNILSDSYLRNSAPLILILSPIC